MPSLIFRKGLDLKQAVAGALAADYHSELVDRIRDSAYRYTSGRLVVHLARACGFCYGVDRAVDYAYQTRRRFPKRPVYLTGEIVHNAHVNGKLRAAGIRFLSDPGEHADQLGREAVVILPAFGVEVAELERYVRLGCTVIDTTCGSVLNVWKTVRQYAADGFTAIIHGKVHHEETRATASQTLTVPQGRSLVVLDRAEARIACDYIRHGGEARVWLARLGQAASGGFDPDRDLQRIGLANQTTMLTSESLEIGDMFRQAMIDRYGDADLSRHYRAFDTICRATQDRQDAVMALVDEHRLDLMLVVGGYNSSNTRNLARMCAERVRTFHIVDAACLVSPDEVRHRPVSAGCEVAPHGRQHDDVVARDWLPRHGPVSIGLTAGASTPTNIIGRVVETLAECAAQA
ncbi:MAG: 4-hydroxy-3-methylbut-2-enyl diphosphate reductase [Vicinamibacterales bacterium]